MSGLKYAIGFFSLAAVVSWAAQEATYLCPSSFRELHLGDTAEQVQTACGKPLSIKEKTQSAIQRNPIEKWLYTLTPRREDSETSVFDHITSARSSQAGSAAVTLAVSFKQGSVTALSLSGQSVDSTSVCGDQTVQLGDTQDQVRSACGEPAASGKSSQTDYRGEETLSVWIYPARLGEAPLTLTFVDNRLAAIDR